MAKVNYISPFATELPKMPKVEGVKLATAHSGMKYKNRDDLTLVELAEGTTVGGVFTKNTMCGAPINWGREILGGGKARALVVNAGIANVFTGKEGQAAVRKTAEEVAKALSCDANEVFVASTGVIGEQVDNDKIINKLPELKENLKADSWGHAARAIMTTDTFAKGLTKKAFIGGTEVTINGIIKGSGMINPDMATMLGYIFTDAKIPAKILQEMMNEDTIISYNCMTVDSDTSTSDMVLAFATGKKEHWEVTSKDAPEFVDFREKFREMNIELAKLVAKDGEGITKFITVNVKGAESDEAARKIGLSIGNSPLVKCAVAGEDPNWGRIIMAIGKSGEKANRDKTSVFVGEHKIAENGTIFPEYKEEVAAKYMKNKEIDINVDVGVGTGEGTIWTMDLTYDYIRINVDYRS